MSHHPAKVLAREDLCRLLAKVAKGRYRTRNRNRVIVLLSVKAGLRACEIARITWPMVTDAQGQIASILELHPKAAKLGSGRRIPIHRDLRLELQRLLKLSPDVLGPVIQSERSGAMTAKSIVNWFKRYYLALNLAGCSSHSGRRTFVTKAARLVHRAGGSLRDVQQLAGHRSIKTTQAYIDGSSDAQKRLVQLL
jgi:integrase